MLVVNAALTLIPRAQEPRAAVPRERTWLAKTAMRPLPQKTNLTARDVRNIGYGGGIIDRCATKVQIEEEL